MQNRGLAFYAFLYVAAKPLFRVLVDIIRIISVCTDLGKRENTLFRGFQFYAFCALAAQAVRGLNVGVAIGSSSTTHGS